MRRVYWAVTDGEGGTKVPGEDLASARAAYRKVLAEWNDNLYRVLVLAGTCFGVPVQRVLRDEVQEEFAAAHRGSLRLSRLPPRTADMPDCPGLGTGWTNWATRSMS
jgi:hypothetical protein